MNGPQMQVIREGLGLTRAELYDLLNADGSERKVGVLTSLSQWERGPERGGRAVPDWLAERLAVMVQVQADRVAAEVAALGEDPVYAIPEEGDEGMPAGYWRAIAWLVAREVPGLRIL